MWDPDQYMRFGAERALPFYDLLNAFPPVTPRTVVDLGCGTGHLTATLARRWPWAHVTGVDASEEMLAHAQQRAEPGRLEFVLSDVRTWDPGRSYDVIVSNALFQWVPDHLDLLRRLATALEPGGVLGFQVPGNFDEPSHTELHELAMSPRWKDRIAGDLDRSLAVAGPRDYLERLVDAGLRARVWETTYLHLLAGDDPVVEWTRGTALRPVLEALTPAEQREFLAEYSTRMRVAYPAGPYGTVLPFRRIFAVATRPSTDRRAPAIEGLDHVQVAAPPGGEDEARAFYGGVLGLVEIPKPEELSRRGGAWFAAPFGQVHVGIDTAFRPARKAHPGLVATDLDALAARLSMAGAVVTWDDELRPRRRLYTDDPFGNRVEILEPPP